MGHLFYSKFNGRVFTCTCGMMFFPLSFIKMYKLNLKWRNWEKDCEYWCDVEITFSFAMCTSWFIVVVACPLLVQQPMMDWYVLMMMDLGEIIFVYILWNTWDKWVCFDMLCINLIFKWYFIKIYNILNISKVYFQITILSTLFIFK